MERPTVFIHTNEQQQLGARVAAHSFRRQSRDPQRFDVHILRLEETPQLHGRDGQAWRWLREHGVLRAKRYLPHPDPRQEALFFALLQQCLDEASLSEHELRQSIAAGHVRPDAFALLAAAAQQQRVTT